MIVRHVMIKTSTIVVVDVFGTYFLYIKRLNYWDEDFELGITIYKVNS